MKRFPAAHATHPQWAMAVGVALAQLRAQMALPDYARAPALGLIYITDHYAAHATHILERLATELPGVSDWVGATGVGVCGAGVEYLNGPALSVMLCDLPRDQYRVYSGVAPLPPAIRFRPHAALAHVDGDLPDLPELVVELAQRMDSGYLFGGITVSQSSRAAQFAWSGSAQGGQCPRDDAPRAAGAADANNALHGVPGVFSGGLSGVAFTRSVTLASRITQGCQPIAPERLVTDARDNLVLTLDDRPALDVLLADLRIDPTRLREALPVLRQTMAGVCRPGEYGVRRTGDFGPGVRVRDLIGVDPGRRGVLLASDVSPGHRLTFCQRDARAARADLVRVCTEIRDALESREALTTSDAEAGTGTDSGGQPVGAASPNTPPAQPLPPPRPRILGAHYVSCAERGGAHFGEPGAELRIIRQALGEDVPLTGFFTRAEIARHDLHRYAGVLTVFGAEPAAPPRHDTPANP